MCMRACRRRVLTSVRARRRLVCVRDRPACAFTSVRCIDVSCACAPCACCHERACASLNNDTSHLLPQRARMRACVLAFARGRRARVFTSVLCMDVSCACVRAVGGFSRACVRVDVSCACVTVLRVLSRACVALTYRVRARRVRVVTSVRARRRLVCAVCVLSRACVCVDVSCACLLFFAGARALWTFGPFPAAISIKYILILISINIHILVSI